MSETAVKKYVVRLAPEERARLEEVIGKGKSPAGMILRARILLKADISDAGEGWSDGRIVKALDTSLATVHRTRQRLVEEGLDLALARKPRARPSIPRIFDGENEARLITLACSKPPAGHAKWSLRLLEQKVVDLGIVAKASDNTIGRTLKKTFSNRT
jgi:transposase